MSALSEGRKWLLAHGFRKSKKRTELWSVEQGLYVIEPDKDTDGLWLCHIPDEDEGAIITRAETPSEAVESALNEFDENSLRIAERRNGESQRLHELVKGERNERSKI